MMDSQLSDLCLIDDKTTESLVILISDQKGLMEVMVQCCQERASAYLAIGHVLGLRGT